MTEKGFFELGPPRFVSNTVLLRYCIMCMETWNFQHLRENASFDIYPACILHVCFLLIRCQLTSQTSSILDPSSFVFGPFRDFHLISAPPAFRRWTSDWLSFNPPNLTCVIACAAHRHDIAELITSEISIPCSPLFLNANIPPSRLHS